MNRTDTGTRPNFYSLRAPISRHSRKLADAQTVWFSTHNTARTSLRTSRTPAEVVAYHIFSLLIYKFVVKCRVAVGVGYQCRRSLIFHVKHFMNTAESITGRIREPWSNFVTSFALTAVTERTVWAQRVCANDGLSAREASRNLALFQYLSCS